jgi:uncharacterized iron-regulated protein
LGTLGCRGSVAARTAVGVTVEDETARETAEGAVHSQQMNPREHAPRSAPVPEDVVARAAAPFIGVRASDGERFDEAGLLDELARYDAVCVGESHTSAPHHYIQWQIASGLAERSRMNGRVLALGFEMLPQASQPVLDAFARGELTLEELPEELDWGGVWGFDFAYYRPLFEVAEAARASTLALNTERTLTRRVARAGLEALTARERKRLPELDLGVASHRAWFESVMREHASVHGHRSAEHPHTSGKKPEQSLDRLYTAQVVWDESMAEQAARFLAASGAAGQILVIAGLGHCRGDAIPRRIQRRQRALRVAAVHTLAADGATGDGQPNGKAKPDAFDYTVVLGQVH